MPAMSGVMTALADGELFAVPTGRAPTRAGKRGSLPDIRRVSLERRGSQSGLLLASNSLSDLQGAHQAGLSGSARSLAGSLRTLSASNLAAISDSNLSLKEAAPSRKYELTDTENYLSRVCFEQLVKRYYYQLTVGCGDDECRNKFCKCSEKRLILSDSLAAVYSVELAAGNKPHLCVPESFKDSPIPEKIFKPSASGYSPFVHQLMLASPFRSLFVETGNINTDDSNLEHASMNDDCYEGEANPDLNVSIIGELPSDIIKSKVRRSLQLRSGGSLTNLNGSRRKSADRALVLSRTGSDGVLSGSLPSLKKLSSLTSFSGSNLSQQSRGLGSANSFNRIDSRSIGSSPVDVYGSNEAMVDQLEEFERQLSFEMSACDIPQEFSLTHVTVPMLESVIETYIHTDDPSFMLNTIRTVFTSSQALNNSFKLNEDLPASVSNLDIVAVRKAYRILSAYSDVFQSPLQNTLDVMLSSLAQSNVTPTEINQVIIIMEAPIFRKKRNHVLRQKFCNVVAGLSNACRLAISQVLSNCDGDTFQRKLMGIYQDHFILSIKPNQRLDADLAAIAETLAVFYNANQMAAKRTGETIIPCKTFYIPELSRLLDFRGEYENWVGIGDGQHRSILDFPFLLDPSSKVHILHLDAIVQMRKEYQEAILHQARINQVRKFYKEVQRPLHLTSSIRSAMCPFLVLEIRRSHLLQDTLAEIKQKESDLKKPIKIKYVEGGEQGLDMGGLQKEFFQLICEAVFDNSYGMFTYSEETRLFWINGSSLDNDEEFELVGIVLGLAIYNGVILDIKFPIAMYKKLQGCPVCLEDLVEAQPTVARSLQELLQYSDGDVDDVFCQTFQISVDTFDHSKDVELVPGGADIPVTNKNRAQFVDKYVQYLLVDSIEQQFQAFKRGFFKVCSSNTLTLFQPDEIELLVCGSPHLDFQALQGSVTYEGGFTESHRVIKWFWSIVHAMSPDHKKMLLHFITGSDRVPLKGLSQLPIVIQRNDSGESNRLPTAMTCFNRLLLPPYLTKDKLKERLYTAIENGKGFGLT